MPIQSLSIRSRASTCTYGLLDWLKKMTARLSQTRSPRRLRVCETLSLGNRGYLAVVRYRQQQFLVGGTNTSIALLAQLSNAISVDGDIEPAKGCEK